MSESARPVRLDLSVNASRDHVLGADTAQMTLVEYGSFACPYCHAAHEIVTRLRDRFGERIRYVFRHRPITGNAEAARAAQLAEYVASRSGDYWPLHHELMQRGAALTHGELDALAAANPVGNPVDQGEWDRAGERVQRDVASARASGAVVSPTFFVNGRRYEGAWDESSLAEAMLGSLGHRLHAATVDFARWAPSTGLLLILLAAVAVAMINSRFGDSFEALWRQPFGLRWADSEFSLPILQWINDGLLTVFFLVVGLEIKRELTVGRLAQARAAALPIAGAIGGMIAPALIYLALVPAGPLAAGWGTTISTDTAFAIALIVLLGARVPVELRVFLTAAVIVDDLVAIVVVAIFYGENLSVTYLGAALATALALVALNRTGVYRPLPYAALGVLLWVYLHHSGLHATLAGVILALVTPTRPPANIAALNAQAEMVFQSEMRRLRESALHHRPSEPTLDALDAIHDRIESPADKLLRSIEPWSSYVVLPLFALANAGVAWFNGMIEAHARVMTAIVAGLVVGKPLGIVLFSALAVAAGWAVKPATYTWRQLAGAATLAGIGFTMSLFIASRAFEDAEVFAAAKIAIFAASVVAACAGMALLWATPHPAPHRDREEGST